MHGSNPTIEAVPTLGNASICSFWWARLLTPGRVALLVLLATLFTLDPAGDRPSLPEGPGLTTDEVLNVEAGIVLWRNLCSYGWGLLDPTSWYEVYSAPGYQSDYPPLGRLILAAGHDAMQMVWPVATDPELGPRPYFTVQARAASAIVYALTVFLVGWFTSRWYGRLAGGFAALALALMPRLFAHAHIASIETIVGFFFTITVLVTADLWPAAMAEREAATGKRSPWSIPWKPVVLTGCLLGLTLLTKIQAILFPVPFSLWAIWRFGRRGVAAVAAVGAISALVLFIGWPWLWIDPLGHAKEYFAPADRIHLYCWYLGQRYLDNEVPWHYPWVMFAVTVPVGLHLLGLYGATVAFCSAKGRSTATTPIRLTDLRLQLILAVMLFPLCLFAAPGIPVYDGERLFLVSFPLWAVCIGRGAACLLDRLTSHNPFREGEAPAEPHLQTNAGFTKRLSRSFALPVIALLLFSESYTFVTLHPCQLSYYSWLTGGLRGASAMGFERTYWADSITRTLEQQIVKQVPEGSSLFVAPVLHPLQLPGMALQSPILKKHKIQLDAYDDSIRSRVKYILVFRRLADPRESLDDPAGSPEKAPPGLRQLAEVRRDGVQLAVLYEITTETSVPPNQ